MFIRIGPDKHEVQIAALIPNLLTTLALCSGLAGIHFATKETPDFPRAMGAILFAAIFDALDGRAARYFRVTSPFGAVLDSLSDFLCFGVAPAVILHQWMLGKEGALGLAAVATYALCAALRLARFTAAEHKPAPTPAPAAPTPAPAHEQKPEQKTERPGLYFTGMPTPAAAGAVLIPPLLAESRNITWNAPAWAVIGFTFLLAIVMISRVPMFSLKRLRISRKVVAPLLVAVGLLVIFFARDPWLTLAGISMFYLVLTPVSLIMHARKRATESAAASAPRAE